MPSVCILSEQAHHARNLSEDYADAVNNLKICLVRIRALSREKPAAKNIMPERTLAGNAVGQHITFISDLALFLGQTSAGLSSTGECIALSKFFANSNPMAEQLSTADAAIPPSVEQGAPSAVFERLVRQCSRLVEFRLQTCSFTRMSA